MANEQEAVINYRLGCGYKVLGEVSSSNPNIKGVCVVIQKGRHIMSINCLGYDEHYNGKTYYFE